MRKFAERKILASPSLSKTLFPTSMIPEDCRWRMVNLPHVRLLTLDRAIELRPTNFVTCRRVKYLLFAESLATSNSPIFCVGDRQEPRCGGPSDAGPFFSTGSNRNDRNHRFAYRGISDQIHKW